MLFIRRQPTETFEETLLERFVAEMTEHAVTAYPVMCRQIGTPQVADAVRRAVDRAKTYGFNNQGPIRLFIEMVFVFGSEFHDDPQYSWAMQILSACTQETQAVCAERLYEHFIDYHDQVAHEGRFADPAQWNGLCDPAHWPRDPRDERFVVCVLDAMERLYPDKYHYQGRGDLVGLIGEARHRAADLGFSATSDYALVALLMFALGHGCLDDPLYPGISAIVRDAALGARDTRAQRLVAHAHELFPALHAFAEPNGFGA